MHVPGKISTPIAASTTPVSTPAANEAPPAPTVETPSEPRLSDLRYAKLESWAREDDATQEAKLAKLFAAQPEDCKAIQGIREALRAGETPMIEVRVGVVRDKSPGWNCEEITDGALRKAFRKSTDPLAATIDFGRISRRVFFKSPLGGDVVDLVTLKGVDHPFLTVALRDKDGASVRGSTQSIFRVPAGKDLCRWMLSPDMFYMSGGKLSVYLLPPTPMPDLD